MTPDELPNHVKGSDSRSFSSSNSSNDINIVKSTQSKIKMTQKLYKNGIMGNPLEAISENESVAATS